MNWQSIGFALLISSPALAEGLILSSPIDCDTSNDCYIQQFVDNDPSEGVRDFTCADLSYDGHKGTDFALPSLARMATGVNVLAAADGVVRGLRNKMPDTGFNSETAASVEGRECGNGLVLAHPGGWETQYCHLKLGSIAVKRGDQVKAGHVLGQVGMSGRAQFPHVHLSVRKDGKVVDPFNPNEPNACKAQTETTLWSELPEYRAAGFISLSFSDHVPSFDALKAGTPTSINETSAALVISAYLFGARKGDVLELSLIGPTDELVSKDIIYSRNQALSFRAIGKKSRGSDWPSGRYQGRAKLIRDEVAIAEEQIDQVFP